MNTRERLHDLARSGPNFRTGQNVPDNLLSGVVRDPMNLEAFIDSFEENEHKQRIKQFITKLKVLLNRPDHQFSPQDLQTIRDARLKAQESIDAYLQMQAEAEAELTSDPILLAQETQASEKAIQEYENILGFLDVVEYNLFPRPELRLNNLLTDTQNRIAAAPDLITLEAINIDAELGTLPTDVEAEVKKLETAIEPDDLDRREECEQALQKIKDLKKKLIEKILTFWEADFKTTPEYVEVDRLTTEVAAAATLADIARLRGEIATAVRDLETFRSSGTTTHTQALSEATVAVNARIKEANDLLKKLDQLEFDLQTLDLRTKIDEINNLTASQAESTGLDNLKRLRDELERLRNDSLSAGIDISSLAVNTALTKISTLIKNQEDIIGPKSESLKLAEGKSIMEIFHDRRTDSFPTTQDATYYNEMMRKVRLLEQNFKDHEMYEKFESLMALSWGMLEFGFFHKKNLNIKDLTGLEDQLIAAAQGDGAMAHNAKFNKNGYVGSEGMDREFWSQDMGPIQKICFVAYQEIKTYSSKYSIGKGFEEKTAQNLMQYICERDQDLSLENENGDKVVINLKRELDNYFDTMTDDPAVKDEILKVFQSLAQLKLSRDNAGFDASAYLMGFNTAAYKFDKPFGGSGKPAGIISAMVYRAGKGSKKDIFTALLSIIDPLAYAIPANPSDAVKKSQIMKVKRVVKNAYNYWNRRNPQVQLDEFPQFRPTLKSPVGRLLSATILRNVMKAPKTVRFERYKPKRFDDDFPRLSYLFNQEEEGMLSSGKYKTARDAMATILEMAVKSRNMPSLPTDVDALKHKVEKMVSDFNTQIATTFSFIENNPYQKDVDAIPNPDERARKQRRVDRNRPYHELILTCYKFFLMNILLNVPGEISMDPTSGYTQQYRQRYKAALTAIIDTLITYDSIKGYYWEAILGKKEGLLNWREEIVSNPHIKQEGFIFQDAFEKIWEDPRYLSNVYFSWKTEKDEDGEYNDPEYAELDDRGKEADRKSNPRDPLGDIEHWGELHEEKKAA